MILNFIYLVKKNRRGGFIEPNMQRVTGNAPTKNIVKIAIK